MSMLTTDRRMREILQLAYQQPKTRQVFYSANSAPIPSERLNALNFWDWTPSKSHAPAQSVSTCMFPLAFGCPAVTTSEGKEWITPRITDPSQVVTLTSPDVWDGRTGQVLRELQAQLATLPEGHLIREPDIQSPLGIAELMWDDSFYYALIEHPAAVHGLLDKITDFVIAFIHEIRTLLGSRLNAAGFPLIWSDNVGTMVADDTMSLISPAMHLEFSIPYLNRLADACGPLYYHSCTWRAEYFDNIHQLRNVRAYNWNPGNSDDPALIIREFSGQAVLAPHIQINMHQDNDLLRFHFADEAELLRYMLDNLQDNSCLYLWLAGAVTKQHVVEKMYDLLDERGFTPQAYGLGSRAR
jgi:hypothetical protein